MASGQTDLNLRQEIVAGNYALSFALVHYLATEEKTGILKAYFDAWAAGRTADQAFSAAFGATDLTALSKALVAHARARLLP
jgi:hypothetical protein